MYDEDDWNVEITSLSVSRIFMNLLLAYKMLENYVAFDSLIATHNLELKLTER